jgi:hypothetical protein
MTDQIIKMTTRGFSNLERALKAESRRGKNALELAMRIEGFRLRKELKERLKKGESAPGIKLKSLTFLARGLGIQTSRRLRKDRPLTRFGAFVRYDVKKSPYEVHVGFVGSRVPKYIKQWVRLHAQGFNRPISKRFRKYIIAQGARRGKTEGGRNPYFLKKGTTRFKTPARPIVDPFWDAERNDALRNISRNFRKKMRGERI